jgi:hypothetical protein
MTKRAVLNYLKLRMNGPSLKYLKYNLVVMTLRYNIKAQGHCIIRPFIARPSSLSGGL